MRRAAIVLVLLAGLGCEERGPSSTTGATSASATPESSATASAFPTASASASAAPDNPYAGTWKGTFEASKGEVTIDEGVPYKTWKEEKGDVATGKGELELVIRSNGAVTGKVTGALGELTVMGVLQDDGEIAASLQPGDPNAEGAMTGTLVGTADKSLVEARIRASSRDGNVVRKAKTTLKKLR
jgi:hypothetical protein